MKSKRLLLTLLLALLVPWAAQAQEVVQKLTNYELSTDVTTFNSIVSTGTQLSFSDDDDGSAAINFPFNFAYGESNFTTSQKIACSANGFIQLGSSATSGTTGSYSGTNRVITPLPQFDGHMSNNSGAGAYWKYDETAQTLTIEYHKLGAYSSPYGIYSYQIVLHKNGDIEFIYDEVNHGTATTRTMATYLTDGANSDRLYVTGAWADPQKATTYAARPFTPVPEHGLRYTFTRPVAAYPTPGDFHVTGSDHESVTLAWATPEQGSNTLTGYAYQYKKASDNDWPTTWTNLDDPTATTVTIHSLALSTNYNFQLKALYGSNESEIVTTDGATTAQAIAVGDSWSDDFEGTECGWELVNGTQTNKWCWGTAVNNGGTHALYISNDGGTTYTYTVSGAERVYATKLLHFENGKYVFTFDWECYGESSQWDYLSVGLLPASATITADNTNSGTLPTGWIALHDQQYLFQQTTWQTAPEKTLQMTAGNYYLVLRWRQDGSGPTSGTIQPAAVDNVSITKLACPYDVAGLAVATDPAPTAHTATINWTNGEPGIWQVAWAKNNSFTGASIETVNTNTINLTELDASSTYYVRVRAYCGGTDFGAWSTPIDFNTECEALTIPANGWSVNFDNMTGVTSGSTNNLPICWNYLNNCSYSYYQGYPVVYNASSSSHSGNNHLRFYSYSSYPATEYAILPEMQNLNGKMIRFYARYYNNKTDLVVGVMTNPADATTFDEVETINDLTTSYKEYTVNFNEVSGGYIAFKMVGNSSYSYYIYVDDIAVMLQPDCATPTDLAKTANSETPEGATITWTAGDGTEWTVEYKKSTEETWTTVTPNVTEATYTFTGLDYSTTYNARVSVVCTAGAGVTYPTDPVSFTTKVQFPAPTNLVTSNLTHESATLAWTAGYTNQTAWKVEYKKNSDEWTAAITEIVSTPTINLNDLVENTTYNVRIYGGIGTEFGTNYLGSNFTTKNPCAAPTALVVSNVTDQSVTLNWTPGYQETSWTVKYKPNSETSWDNAIVIENATKPLTINDLTGGTTYNVQVINCENALSGNFTTAFGVPFFEDFEASTTTIPSGWTRYSGLLSEVLAGTTQLTTTTDTYWGFNNTAPIDNYHATINIYNDNRKHWLVTPTIINNNDNNCLSFEMCRRVYSAGECPDDIFAVLYSINNGTTWTVLRQWDNAGSEYVYNDLAVGKTIDVYLPLPDETKNQAVCFAFYGESTINGNGDYYIDINDVSVDAPSCFRPSLLTSSDVTNHSATLTWTAGSSDQHAWQVAYSKTTFDPFATSFDLATVETVDFTTGATCTYRISDLDAASTYYMYIRANCGTATDPDYGPWSRKGISLSTSIAAPAPSNFITGIIGVHTAELVWNAGGGDYETSWDLYYVKSDDAPEAPTEETPATKTVTTLPTTENPYNLDELDEESRYYIWVRGNNGSDGYSAWTALTGDFFTTLSNCEAPYSLNAADITGSSAELSWIGVQESYNVRYCKLIPGEAVTTTEKFESYEAHNYNATSGDRPSDWAYSTGHASYFTPQVSNNELLSASYYGISAMSDQGNFLYMLSANNYAVMPRIENLTSFTFKYAFENANNGTFKVGYVTDASNISGTFTQFENVNTPGSTSLTPITLTDTELGILNSTEGARLAFNFNYSGSYGFGIDDITYTTQSYTPTAWNETNTNVTSPITIDELEMGTRYGWQVQGINAGCTGGLTEWSEMATFNTPFTKVINAYSGDGGYYLIASPLATAVNPVTVGMITDELGSNATAETSTYDLYWFDQTSVATEWQNYRVATFDLVNGMGYLYASKEGTTLTFIGTPGTNGEVSLVKDDDPTATPWAGWNLVGNPFGVDAYITKPFYTLENSNNFTPNDAGTAIQAMQGLMVVADNNDETLTFSTEAPAKNAKLNMNVSEDHSVVDQAIVSFNKGQQLPKLQFRNGSSKVYIPMEGKDYAVVSAGKVGEIPVSFKAEKNGSYTLSFTSQEVSFSYLHLIDNLTGNDVDLLDNPSYSFDAQTTDYAQRFRLVFATGSSVDGDSFAFINGAGNLSIFGIEGTATVQVMDVLGHVLSSESFSGSYEKQLNVAPGVYMIRLINGNDVKVQKMIVK